MTSICEGEPAKVRKTDAFDLAVDLTLAVAAGVIPDRLYFDLVKSLPVQRLRQSFKYRPEISKESQVVHGVHSIDQIKTAVSDAGTGD